MLPRRSIHLLTGSLLVLALGGCSTPMAGAYQEQTSAVYAAPLVQGAGSLVVHPSPTVYAVPSPAFANAAPVAAAMPMGATTTVAVPSTTAVGASVSAPVMTWPVVGYPAYAYGHYPPSLMQTQDPLTGEQGGAVKAGSVQ